MLVLGMIVKGSLGINSKWKKDQNICVHKSDLNGYQHLTLSYVYGDIQ